MKGYWLGWDVIFFLTIPDLDPDGPESFQVPRMEIRSEPVGLGGRGEGGPGFRLEGPELVPSQVCTKCTELCAQPHVYLASPMG